MDTVRWNEDTAPPLVTDEDNKPVKPVRKEKYTVSLLLPFAATSVENPDAAIDPKVTRFIQYYAGMRLAIRQHDSLVTPITFHAFDDDGSSIATESILRKSDALHADVIVGPYEKEGIEAAAAFGLKHETMVISPWLPAFSMAVENPHFIQAVPGLPAHAETITRYLAEAFPGKKIFLVARNNPAEINRLLLFKKNEQLTTEDLIISDASPDLERTDLRKVLAPDGTVFVLPYYAKADEAFVNSFLRKLHADKELNEVMVIGMPQWLGFTNLNPNYLESLRVHLSVSTFIDTESPAYTDFRNHFFEAYHTVPDLQAFLGYDLVRWITHCLSRGGKEAMIGPESFLGEGLASGFDIRPVFKQGVSTGEMNTPLYYENRHIRIVKYEAQDYHLVR